MKKILLNIKGLSYSERQTGAYALILAEDGGQRKLPIVIGGFEAQSIAIALEKMVYPPRPLTHDLFKNFAVSFGIDLIEIVIHKIKDGVFFANLVCEKEGKIIELDSRPSDAVALAIRFQCPIFTTEEVLESAGLILSDEEAQVDTEEIEENKESIPSDEPANPMKDASLSDLQNMLEQAVLKEDYELAARIRDEMDRRQA